MSTARDEGARVPQAGVISTLRRALVVAGDAFATPQDQIDCAELLLATGFADAARLLYELAHIRTGFATCFAPERAEVAARTGLWPQIRVIQRSDDIEASFMVDRAVLELTQLLAVAPDPALSIPGEAKRLLGAAVLDSAAQGSVAPHLDGQAFGALSTRLYRALSEADDEALTAVLDEVRLHILDRPTYQLAAHFNASVIDLAAMAVFNGLQRFFRRNIALCWAPFGSAVLLSAAARLEHGGLGAYFNNVPCLIRTSRDLFGLLDLAAGGQVQIERHALECWCVLLSAHLDQHDRVELADDLGDMGLMHALWGLLEHAMSNPGLDGYLYWAIRDAALDNGDTALAIAAQRRIASMSHRNAGEWIVLSDILVSARALNEAEDALNDAIAIAPNDRQAITRLAALRENRIEAYRVERGFGSSKHRSALRMRNRVERASA